MNKILIKENQKRPFPAFFILCFLILILADAPEITAATKLPGPYRSNIMLGIEKSLNMENAGANAYLQKAIEIDPENPAGYAYLAMVSVFFYENSFDETVRKEYQENILRYVDEAVAKGEKRVEKNPQDSQAYLAMAVAKITKLHWATHQKKYLTIANESSNIWNYLEKARAGDPQNYDISFFMGLFHYHIVHLPALARVFSSLLVTGGDRQKGLQEIEIAANKGDMLKQIALLELSTVYLYFEKQPARALAIYRELKEKFPNNYNFLFGLGNALSETGRFDEALKTAREIEQGIQSGKQPFAPQLQPRYDQLMGRILFDHREYDKAKEYFQKSLKDNSAYNARIRVWSYVRLGMIHDVRKERKQAEDYYTRAMDVNSGEGAAQIEAKKYLAAPYVQPAKI
jgi:tetratricopeptide (TPR) repeat protein